MDIGSKLRLLRQRRKISLRSLAALSGYSSSYLSQVERDAANPSINVLKAITDALGVPLAALFDESPSDQPEGNIVRVNQRKRLQGRGHGFQMFLLSPHLNANIELIMIVAEPGGNSGKGLYSHKGEEIGLVLSGSIVIYIGDKRHVLYEGDSMYFTSETSHRWENPGTRQSISVWAVTPPSF